MSSKKVTETDAKLIKKEKPIKSIEKFIWFAVSVVIAGIGIICVSNDVDIHIILKILFPALMLFTIIMASQKTSIERFSFAGENGNRQKFLILSVLYYLFIILAVIYVFLSIWIIIS